MAPKLQGNDEPHQPEPISPPPDETKTVAVNGVSQSTEPAQTAPAAS